VTLRLRGELDRLSGGGLTVTTGFNEVLRHEVGGPVGHTASAS